MVKYPRRLPGWPKWVTSQRRKSWQCRWNNFTQCLQKMWNLVWFWSWESEEKPSCGLQRFSRKSWIFDLSTCSHALTAEHFASWSFGIKSHDQVLVYDCWFEKEVNEALNRSWSQKRPWDAFTFLSVLIVYILFICPIPLFICDCFSCLSI